MAVLAISHYAMMKKVTIAKNSGTSGKPSCWLKTTVVGMVLFLYILIHTQLLADYFLQNPTFLKNIYDKR